MNQNELRRAHTSPKAQQPCKFNQAAPNCKNKRVGVIRYVLNLNLMRNCDKNNKYIILHYTWDDVLWSLLPVKIPLKPNSKYKSELYSYLVREDIICTSSQAELNTPS